MENLENMSWGELIRLKHKITNELEVKAQAKEAIWRDLTYYDEKTDTEVVVEGYTWGYHETSNDFLIKNAKGELVEPHWFEAARLYWWDIVDGYIDENDKIKTTISSKRLEKMLNYQTREEWFVYKQYQLEQLRDKLQDIDFDDLIEHEYLLQWHNISKININGLLDAIDNYLRWINRYNYDDLE